MSAVGRFEKEMLECGCVLSGVRHSSKRFDGEFDRGPCKRHTVKGACSLCREGVPHPVCKSCGLSDGRHGWVCQ